MSVRHGSDSASTSGEGSSQDLFQVHKLSKMDTLAGLAIRYNVTVSDIKRSNSFLSDSAMFARESLLIPTRSLPMGNEYSAWAGMIVAQYGQIDRGQEHVPPPFAGGSHGSSRESASLSAIDQLRSHYGLMPVTPPSSGARSDKFERFQPGEVEMQDLTSSSQLLPRRPLPQVVSYAGDRSGPQVGDERLRRRPGCDNIESWDGTEPLQSASWEATHQPDSSAYSSSSIAHSNSGSLHSSPHLPPDHPKRRPPMAPSLDRAHLSPTKPRQVSATAAAPKAALNQREGIFAKVKRVTSQPSLAITAASQAAANAVARVSEAASSGAMRRQSSGCSDARSQGQQQHDSLASRSKPAKSE